MQFCLKKLGLLPINLNLNNLVFNLHALYSIFKKLGSKYLLHSISIPYFSIKIPPTNRHPSLNNVPR